MGEPGGDIGAELLTLLESYYQATVDLLAALRQGNDAIVSAAVAVRAACIGDYAVAMARWNGLPAGARAPEVDEQRKWHHIRINDLDSEVLSFTRTLKDKVGEEISRLGAVRKMDRAYLNPTGKPIQILTGEG